MSVGPGGDTEPSKSLPETFFEVIGAQGGQLRSLYKIPVLSWRSSFLIIGEDEQGSSGIDTFPDIRGTDVETDL